MENLNFTKEQIAKNLSEVSYQGKDYDFVNDPNNQKLYLLLMELYGRADKFIPSLKFIHTIGTYTSRDFAIIIRKALEEVGSYALEGRRKHFLPFYPNVDFEKLIFEREGKLTFDPHEDMNFWDKAIETISIDVEGLPQSCILLDIFDVIAKIERKLRIKGQFKRKYTFKPTGKVVGEGTVVYKDGKTMRKLASQLKKKTVQIDFNNGSLIWNEGCEKPEIKNRTLLPVKLKGQIEAKSIKNLYGECKYEIIVYPEGNASYLYIINPKGMATCILLYKERVTTMPECFLETDMSFQFEKDYKEYPVIRTYGFMKVDLNGIEVPSNLKFNLNANNNLSLFPFPGIKESNPASIKIGKKKEFISPLTQDNVIPTLLASNHRTSFKNMLTTGDHRNPGVIRIEDTYEKNSGFDLSNPFWVIALSSPLFKRKYDGYNKGITDILENTCMYKETRNISNYNLRTIVNEIKKMKSHQKVVGRTLDPREKFVYMGFPKKYINKICKMNLSDTALDTVAGNSIVPPVLARIFEAMFIPKINQQSNLIAKRA